MGPRSFTQNTGVLLTRDAIHFSPLEVPIRCALKSTRTVLCKLQLSSGRAVSVDSLHVSRTYAGLLEGFPDDLYNANLIVRASRALVSLWGERATSVIPPKIHSITDAGRTYNRLPEIRYHAWLTSEPMKSPWCASELVVIWFGPRALGTPLTDILAHAIADIPWEKAAQDFDY